MQYRKLGQTDLTVSILGFGSSPLGDVYSIVNAEEAERAVALAIDEGINFFDVSPYYGANLAEQRLGKALKGRRSKVVLATKCGRYGLNDFDFSAQRITNSIDESLRRLLTDHVDLLQVHDVEFGTVQQIVEETLPALRRLQKQGKARYIGITGYSLKTLVEIASAAPVDSILTYCRYNLMVSDMDKVLTPFAQKHGVGLINASGLHMGVLTDKGAPGWHPAPQLVRESGRKAASFCREHGENISSIALRYCLDHNYVSSTLVGMCTQKEVLDNLASTYRLADPGLVNSIQRLMQPALEYVWPSGRPENYG
ncbi:MAG TPA: aldo/keto reductase [Candidatus Angelobacter sp.]